VGEIHRPGRGISGFHLREIEEKLAMFGVLRDIDEDSDQVVAIGLSLVPPEAANHLGLGRDSAEALLQFQQGLRDEVIGHGLAVIEPKREQDLVATE
jgi:hypothetical protein